MKLQFLGAAECVTGSKHLLTTDSGKRILFDCGMYQGKGMDTDALNRDLGFNPDEIDIIILSHAHIDHSGLLPYVYKKGFRGEVISTPATRDLCDILLQDTAFIQSQDIKWYNKKMERLNKPKIEPLYDIRQVEQVMLRFRTVPYDRPTEIADGIMLTFTNSGHMLGSAISTVETEGKRIVYTGDIGRAKSHILCSPVPFKACDFLICESTYGDRIHEDTMASEQELLGVVEDTCVYKKGKLLIPSFSVGRTQEIVYVLNQLFNEGYLPDIPIYVDSPLSCKATEIFRHYTDLLNEDVKDTSKYDDDVFGFKNLHFIEDIRESKALNTSKKPCIIISASGMLEAGRIKHHVANHIDDPSTTILFVGYCAPETLGARIQDPKRDFVSIFGFDHRVRAQIAKIEGFSGHGDYREMIDYLRKSCISPSDSSLPVYPKRTFIVHGEASAAEAYREHLMDEGFLNVEVPKRGKTVVL